MATITLVANTNYSAIVGLANGDTIALSGFRLTIDAQPTHTGIFVTTVGTSGTVVVSGSYNMSTWSFTAGTSQLITTFPAGATAGTVTGGSVGGANGITTNNGIVLDARGGGASAPGINANNGTVTTATGGSASGSHGVLTNNSAGVIGTAVGGSVNNAQGCSTNSGTITAANGGSTINSAAVGINNGIITTATGGSAQSANGVNTNNGTVTTAVGGSVANAVGVATNNGLTLNLTDAFANAVSTWLGRSTFVFGPGVVGTIKSPITTIYSLGAMNPAATLPSGVTVIRLSEGTARPSNPFLQQVIG
jgi:hypothetical protein